ncbi:MAG: DUF2807 domain-containing protein [Thermomicrobiales bacterium]|nr:MAG: DUF2807 domain-containing protein [Thermomicrobiales bacterium]
MRQRFRALPIGAATLLLSVLALTALSMTAAPVAAQGTTKTEEIALDPFTSIQINGGGTATLTFGDTPSVTITGNSLIVDQLDAKVENGQLVLGSVLTSALDVSGLSELTYTIVAPAVDEIHLSGTVSLTVPVLPAQDTLVLGLTTGAHLTIGAMDVQSLTGKLDLLSNATLTGAAGTMQLEINNGSELHAGELQVGSADLVLNGMAKATVRVTDTLTGRAAQGSTVEYITETVTPEMTTTTMASVTALEFTPWSGVLPAAAPGATPAA